MLKPSTSKLLPVAGRAAGACTGYGGTFRASAAEGFPAGETGFGVYWTGATGGVSAAFG